MNPNARARAAVAATLATIAGYCVATGWGRWGDLMVDTGRELEWPRRILEGELLYRDLRFNYGPLAPHVNAVLYALFGVRVEVLAAAGVVSALVAGTILYRIARRFLARPASVTIVATYFLTCAFAHQPSPDIFNWVLPHTYAATYGMLAALAALHFLLRFVAKGRAYDSWLAVGMLALAALSKAECSLPPLAAHGGWLIATRLAHSSSRKHLARLGSGLTVVVAIYGWFYAETGPSLWRDNLAGVINPGSTHFVLMLMGLDDPWQALLHIALSLAGFAVLGLLAVLASRTALFQRGGRPVQVVVPTVALVAVVVALGTARGAGAVVFCGSSLIIAVVLLAQLILFTVQEPMRKTLTPHLLVFVFALACLPRIFMRATPVFYGYFLFPSALLCLGIALCGYLPAWCGTATAARRAVSIGGMVLLLCAAALTHRTARIAANRRDVALETPRGRMWLTATDADRFLPMLRAIDKSPPSTRLLVVPQASAINFFSERPGVDGMFSHLPMDYYGGFTDQAIIARWQRSPPDLVLWNNVPMPYFGNARYCATYGQAACAWLWEHYRVALKIDEVLLLSRASAGP
ncbi:MAG: hypothetical protein HY903_20620 [Deltaproteobacteria bacterium]|nr:hypothetical protein [Deltaproteobacteria bacterium]